MFCQLLSMEGYVVDLDAATAHPADATKHDARREAGRRRVEREVEAALRPPVPRGWR